MKSFRSISKTSWVACCRPEWPQKLILRPLRKEPLPEHRPFLDRPKREASHRLLQEGHVIGDQEQPEGQHPQSKEWQYREDSAQHQEDAHGNPDPSRIGMAEIAEDVRDFSRNLMFQMSECLPENGSAAMRCHACRRIRWRRRSSIRIRMPSGGEPQMNCAYEASNRSADGLRLQRFRF